MTRIFAIIVAALVILLATVGLWGYAGHQKAAGAVKQAEAIATQLDTANAALKAAKRERDIAQAVSASRNAEAITIEQRHTSATGKAHEATQANPEWSATPVPDSVWDAILTGPFGGSVPSTGPPINRVPSAPTSGAD